MERVLKGKWAVVVMTVTAAAICGYFSADFVWRSGVFFGLVGWEKSVVAAMLFAIEALIYVGGFGAVLALGRQIFLWGAMWTNRKTHVSEEEKPATPGQSVLRTGVVAVMIANLFFSVCAREALIFLLGRTDIEKVFDEESSKPNRTSAAKVAVPVPPMKEATAATVISTAQTTRAQAGLEILRGAAVGAADDLRQRGVPSKARPGELVVSEENIELSVLIVLAEQPFTCSPFDSRKTVVEQRGCMTGLLEKIAANPAVLVTGSPGGAYGAGQVMPKTYQGLRVEYPTASLSDNANHGRAELVSAFKLILLNLDYNESRLSSKARSRIKNEAWRQKVLVATHNTNVDTVSRALEAHADSRWREADPLSAETIGLIRKFIWITENLEEVSRGPTTVRWSYIPAWSAV
ncbi:MAG: hypothetical protein V1664_04700 [Candidatus Uhrbacteria bacterium]